MARARDAGKCFGRPPILNEEQKQKVLERIKSGASISAIAREFRTTRQTILRVRAKQQMLLYKKIVLAWDIFRFPGGPLHVKTCQTCFKINKFAVSEISAFPTYTPYSSCLPPSQGV
ncbi:TPA: Hin recombinase [Escherichia coli]|nr:Hin recombinase [Escherichia coli]HAJ7170579.1 Hin recombinase [Escherichia coli]HAJ7199906.1 Hin recombinase [Escherichia coli]